jgi:hypothetical protein
MLFIWLAGIVGYFVFSNVQNIKVIPASLGWEDRREISSILLLPEQHSWTREHPAVV